MPDQPSYERRVDDPRIVQLQKDVERIGKVVDELHDESQRRLGVQQFWSTLGKVVTIFCGVAAIAITLWQVSGYGS